MGLVNAAPPLHAPATKVTAKNSTKKPETQVDPNVERRSARATTLNGIAQIISAGLMMTGQYADSEALTMYSPGIAFQAAVIADDHEGFANFVDQADAVSPYIALATATIPLVLQVMANHGRIKPERASGMGVVNPELLETRSKTRLARQQAEAMRMQQEMERQAREEYEAVQRAQQEMMQEPVPA